VKEGRQEKQRRGTQPTIVNEQCDPGQEMNHSHADRHRERIQMQRLIVHGADNAGRPHFYPPARL
jgi:hypothetical protein